MGCRAWACRCRYELLPVVCLRKHTSVLATKATGGLQKVFPPLLFCLSACVARVGQRSMRTNQKLLVVLAGCCAVPCHHPEPYSPCALKWWLLSPFLPVLFCGAVWCLLVASDANSHLFGLWTDLNQDPPSTLK